MQRRRNDLKQFDLIKEEARKRKRDEVEWRKKKWKKGEEKKLGDEKKEGNWSHLHSVPTRPSQQGREGFTNERIAIVQHKPYEVIRYIVLRTIPSYFSVPPRAGQSSVNLGMRNKLPAKSSKCLSFHLRDGATGS
jgi:hypothetical protein